MVKVKTINDIRFSCHIVRSKRTGITPVVCFYNKKGTVLDRRLLSVVFKYGVIIKGVTISREEIFAAVWAHLAEITERR